MRLTSLNRPDLDAIRTRVGTHGSFLADMLERVAAGQVAPLSGLHVGGRDDAAVALCDAWAAICDVLSFYGERIANEGYLRTATERRSIAEIARLVGYRMRPGVAASAAIAFTLEGGADVVVPAATRLQTVPEGDETARCFELAAALDARSAWNTLAVARTRPFAGGTDSEWFLAAGVTPALRPADTVLMQCGAAATLRRVDAVAVEFGAGRIKVALACDDARAAPAASCALAGLADGIRDALDAGRAAGRRPRRHQSLSELLAPEGDLAMRLRGMSVRDGERTNLFAALDALPGGTGDGLDVHAMTLRTAPFGAAAPPRMKDGHPTGEDWPLDEAADVLFIDTVAATVQPGGWVAFEAPPGLQAPPPRRVVAASVVVRAAYGIVGRCTRLQLDRSWFEAPADDAPPPTLAWLRALSVHAGSVKLVLAEEDIADPVEGTEIDLDGVVGELPPGRALIVEGEPFGCPGARVAEGAVLAASRHVLPENAGVTAARTRLSLAAPLAYRYRRDSVVIWGNVGEATEGEQTSEVLGSGDNARVGQSFTLARGPLTNVPAPTESGAASTLRVVVDGLEWQEVETLASAGPLDRVFVVEPPGVEALRIRFGDGVNGARLPSGIDNVLAHYRVGLGTGGNVAAGRISQLLSRPAGVRSAVNPRPASGGADPESSDDARWNAAVGVTALRRLVGVRDYADFARSFAGMAKADAMLIRPASGVAVLVTIAGVAETQIGPDAELLTSLANALERWGDPAQPVIVRPARHLRVALSARVRLGAGWMWDWVAPRLRARLLDRFGFARRGLGQYLHQSEILACMLAADGVEDVELEVLAALPDPVTSDILDYVATAHATDDLRARPGRLASLTGGETPRAAEIVFFSSAVPELVVLAELAG